MKQLTQTRIHRGMEINERGNCFASCIACIMDLESPEDVIQIQEYYEDTEQDWRYRLVQWLWERGYIWYSLPYHVNDGKPYFVDGFNPDGVRHVVIFKDGEMIWDTNPLRRGITDGPYFFHRICKIP